MTTNARILLRRAPAGWIEISDFEVRREPAPVPGEGEVLLRHIYLSCDPYLRGLLGASYGRYGSVEVGDTVRSRVVAEVAAGEHPELRPGDLVWGFLGWEEWSVARDGLYRIDPTLGPISNFISVLGMPGLTAYVGMLQIGKPRAGEQVFVSSAAGAVGQIAAQLAKRNGARVVGSAGTDEKVAYLTGTLGLDAAFNYRDEPVEGALARLFPDGIDVYFENVGGATLDAVLRRVNPHARIAACGMISQYNLEQPEGIFNLNAIVGNRVHMQGFVVSDHLSELDAFTAQMSRWLRDGEVRYHEDIIEGIDNAPDALVGMFKGSSLGKRLVRVGPDPTLAPR